MNAISIKHGAALDSKATAIALDLKKLDDDGMFEGYGSTFNNVDNGGDRVLPGAFQKSLARKGAGGIKLLRDHDRGKIAGKWLEMREDDNGLYCKGKIFAETDIGKETLFLMREKQLTALSIGYRTIRAQYSDAAGDDDIRDLMEVDLWEVSVVPFPMNDMAQIRAVKGDWAAKDIERHLREGGVPDAFAKMVVSFGYDEAVRRVAKDRREGDYGEKEIIDDLNNLAEKLKG